MQASKIMPGATYAINYGKGVLARFRVTAVITRRDKATGSPRDYQSKIEGYVAEPDGAKETLTLDPDQILGNYEEHIELRDRKRKEDEAKERKEQERRDRRHKLVLLLYKATGLEVPEKLSDYKSPYRESYSSIEISEDGVQPLIDLLEKL